MVKKYLYKTYSRTRSTIKQRVIDGDFEGLSNDNFANYWTTSGSPTEALRDRVSAAPSDVLGKALTLDGSTNRITVLKTGTVGVAAAKDYQYGHSSQFTHNVSYYKAAYTGTGKHYLVFQSAFTTDTMAMWLDYGTGNLTARIALLGVYYDVTYPIASISAGYHNFAFGTDNRYVKLFVDGVEVASNDSGSPSTVIDGGDFVYIGATKPGATAGFADGTFDGYSFYNTLLTAAQHGQIHRSRNPRSANLVAHYDFDEGSGSALNNVGITNYGGTIGGAANWVSGWSTVARSVMIRTSTGGSATQGIKQASGYECNIVGGAVYTASAYVLGTLGATINLIITPTGGGSAQTVSVTATGAWQKIVSTYTSNIAATKLTLEITLSAASASVKTFYVDKIALNDGALPYDYFDATTQPAGSLLYQYDATSFVHQVLSIVYTYLKTWADVASDFEYEEEINTAGSVLQIDLARSSTNAGEHADLDFGNEVRVFVIDDQQINGQQVFKGYIENYTTNEVENNVRVVVFSYGSEADATVVKAGELRVGIQPIEYQSKTCTNNYGGVLVIPFTPSENVYVRRMVLKMSGSGAGGVLPQLALFKGNPLLNSYTVTAGSSVLTVDPSNTLVGNNINEVTADSPTAAEEEFIYDDLLCYAGQDYYFQMQFYTDDDLTFYGAGAADNPMATTDYPPFGHTYLIIANTNNVGYAFDVAGNLSDFPAVYAELLASEGSTTAELNSVDPAAMLRFAMDWHARQGGVLTYDEASIPLTNTLASYKFRFMTLFEWIDKCLELAPAGYYYYVNEAEGKLYFKKKSDSVNHYFALGKHLETLVLEKRTEDIINVVLFSGGDLGEGLNLFREYRNEASIALYGARTLKYSDGRVTRLDTAALISNTILEKNSYPEVRASITVLDTYDIELIKPGDVAGFRNFGDGARSSSDWDEMYWDEGYWDFDISDPASFEFQIARFHYLPDGVSMVLSTTPPDVNKRIEDIKRNLDAELTVNNPSDPVS